MLTYVAAVATAATLLISPVMRDSESVQKKEPIRWAMPSKSDVSISSTISLSGADTLYFLSVAEQRILKNALLRSARVVNPGQRRI